MTTIRLRIRSIPGDSASGFEAELMSQLDSVEIVGAHLPPLPADLKQSLEAWKKAYRNQEEVRQHYPDGNEDERSEDDHDDGDSFRIGGGRNTTPPSRSEIQRLVQSLKDQFDRWLASGDHDWQRIRETLVRLAPQSSDETRLVLDFENEPDLRRLPWQEWSLFEECYSRIEPALKSPPQRGPAPPIEARKRSKIRILVVLGESTGINTQADLDRVTQLAADQSKLVEVIPLIQPKRKELQDALRDEDGYDLFIYIGHSRSNSNGAVGWLLLNQQDEISIQEFKFSFSKTIRRGLRLAIFNSCDGLGLAKQLADLNLSQCIVMKEPVPDRAAIEFLDRFFYHFAKRLQPLLTAVHEARQELEHFNDQYPNVTWLPTVCVKSNVEVLTWQSLIANLIPPRSWWQKLLAFGLTAWRSLIANLRSPRQRWLKLLALILITFFTVLLLSPPVPNQMLVSAGEKRIFGSTELDGDYEDWKQDGIRYFQRGEYVAAANSFSQIRNTAKDAPDRSTKYTPANDALKDPEVLIYQNNALARFNHANGEPMYTIAAAVPLSDRAGNSFDRGQQLLFGIAQMQDKALGSKTNLQVVLANDLNDAKRAKAVAEELKNFTVEGQKILAVVGHYLSESTCEALPVYKDANLVVVSPSSTLTGMRKKCGDSNVFFRTTSSAAVEAETLVNYLRQYLQQQQRSDAQVAIFYSHGEIFSQDLYEQISNKLLEAVKVVSGENTSNLLSPGFNADESLQQFDSVDALFVLPDGQNKGSEAYKNALALLKQNQGQKLILGSNPLLIADTITNGGELANLKDKLVLASDWEQSCAPQEFRDDAEYKYWYGGVNRLTALAYEAVQVLLDELKPGVTSDQIKQGLQSSTGIESGVFRNKTISFDENGDRNEIESRLLLTPSGSEQSPSFALLEGQFCSAN